MRDHVIIYSLIDLGIGMKLSEKDKSESRYTSGLKTWTHCYCYIPQTGKIY